MKVEKLQEDDVKLRSLLFFSI